MVRASNSLVGILNFVTFLLSVPILGFGIWLSKHGTTVCDRFLHKPIIALGVFIMIVSLAGLIGACCRVSLLLWVYLLVMFLLIVLFFCFTIFAFVVTNKGAGHVVSERGYKEYKLGDYSNWLQNRVNDDKNWNKIKSCLIDGQVCKSMKTGTNTTVDAFHKKHLDAIQSGCCKPAEVCKFQYVTPTQWTKPANVTTTYANADCYAWDNAENILCFNCSSCKAGVLDSLKSDWKKDVIFNIVFLVFLIIVYTIGCCAFRNNREDKSYKRQYP